jgi:ribokinase
MDFTAFVDTFPQLGETRLGDRFTMVPGGKGFNQALASARQGVPTVMLGCIGDDELGDAILEVASGSGMITDLVYRLPESPSGVAHITVDQAGDNRIVVMLHANAALSTDHVDAAAEHFSQAAVVLTQFETPLPVVEHTLAAARAAGVTTIVNPAPAQQPSDQLLSSCDWLIPNETELELLTGYDSHDLDQVRTGAVELLARGVGNVVVTLGERGALWVSATAEEFIATPTVQAVDATAAGDAFCGTFAAALAYGLEPGSALKRAASAGAVTVTVPGASPSLPTREQVDAMLGG